MTTEQMMIWRPTLNKDKYKQVVLFILNGAANNPLLGKVKLFKLLYYVDFDHVENYDAPVTGDVYRKEMHGPFPSTGDAILSEMKDEGLIDYWQEEVRDNQKYCFRAKRAPDESLLTRSELKVLEQVVSKWANHTREEIENATHGEAPWVAVEMGEEIPYTLAYYRSQPHECDEDVPDAALPTSKAH